MARNPEQAWRKWHWKTKKDTDLPRRINVPTPHIGEDTRLIEAGALTSLHLDPMDGKKRYLRSVLPTAKLAEMTDEAALEGNEPDRFSVIEVAESDWPNNWIAFDHDHPSQRLYLLLSPSTRRDVAQTLWEPGEATMPLGELAEHVGGIHGDADDYPDIDVQPLGRIFYMSYFTHKQGDDPASIYIHRMGEEGGIEPILAVSEDGRLWIAGGSYTCPDPGITQ
jgi:hypothetical protein